LSAQRQSTTVPDTAIATQVHETLDVHRYLTAQIAFDCQFRDSTAEICNLWFRQVFNLRMRGHARCLTNLLRA
jgi:hypothetical protein